MKFKDLRMYQSFYFASEKALWPHSITQRPWIKISHRKYLMATSPFSDDPDERALHAEQSFTGPHQVSSINVEVYLPEKDPTMTPEVKELVEDLLASVERAGGWSDAELIERAKVALEDYPID